MEIISKVERTAVRRSLHRMVRSFAYHGGSGFGLGSVSRWNMTLSPFIRLIDQTCASLDVHGLPEPTFIGLQ